METPTPDQLELDSEQARALAGSFAAPSWLRDLGITSWFLLGLFGVLAAVTWLLGTANTIVGPVTVAMIIAAVCIPLVTRLSSHRVPRVVGAAIVLLGLAAVAAIVVILVIGGITSQHDEISKNASAAADTGSGWLKSLGVSETGASGAKADASSGVPAAISTLVTGVVDSLKGLTSFAFALSLGLLSTFFLLKDGPSMRSWVDGHLGVPRPVAQTITGNVIRSLRGYFRGVSLVAAFNAVVITIGAYLLDVPLAGTIGVVTFVTAYIPYLGAFVSGAFAVVIALGSQGTTTAVIMLIIVLLANGLLQNVVQPFAMGSALDLHPLVVLVITIAAGCLFGMVGLVLSAPLTSAGVHIVRELGAARARVALSAPGAEPDPPLQAASPPPVPG